MTGKHKAGHRHDAVEREFQKALALLRMIDRKDGHQGGDVGRVIKKIGVDFLFDQVRILLLDHLVEAAQHIQRQRLGK